MIVLRYFIGNGTLLNKNKPTPPPAPLLKKNKKNIDDYCEIINVKNQDNNDDYHPLNYAHNKIALLII